MATNAIITKKVARTGLITTEGIIPKPEMKKYPKGKRDPKKALKGDRTEALISAIPELDPDAIKKFKALEGEVPSAINSPIGCRFHPRCPYRQRICSDVEPVLGRLGNTKVACHLPLS